MKTLHVIILALALLTPACDTRKIRDIIYPADENMVLPTGKKVRLHCNPTCPPHEDILRVMGEVRGVMMPHTTYDPWRVWSAYAINFSEDVQTLADGRQVWGATDHNIRGLYIHYEPEYKGIRKGVLDWELKLPLIEKEIPRSTEVEKIQWLRDRNIPH